MATWNSRGLRGSQLEEEINRTNDVYIQEGLCLVQKIPTPITPIKIDKENKQITLAYFEQKSTVDYIGVAQGYPICFDAKESKTTTFSMQNIHPHQVEFMQRFEKQQGIAFFLICFSGIDVYYYLPDLDPAAEARAPGPVPRDDQQGSHRKGLTGGVAFCILSLVLFATMITR